MKHNQHAKGFRSMMRLRAHPIIAARDFYYSNVIYAEELKLAGGQGYFQRLSDCFAVPRIRRSNYGASTVMIAQQMCGINSTFACIPYQILVLTGRSHLFLQLNYLQGGWVHSNSVALRIFGLRCHSGRFNDTYVILD
jgi:hypothetical protein